jgi:hypothetical protein
MSHVEEACPLVPVLGATHSDGLRPVILCGRILVGTSGAVSSSSSLPNGCTVAETATGVYTVTAPSFAPNVGPHGFCTMFDASGGDTYATGKTCSQTAGVCTLVISTFGADGSAEEPASSDYIDFMLVGYQ